MEIKCVSLVCLMKEWSDVFTCNTGCYCATSYSFVYSLTGVLGVILLNKSFSVNIFKISSCVLRVSCDPDEIL